MGQIASDKVIGDFIKDPLTFLRHNLLRLTITDIPPHKFQPGGTVAVTLEDTTKDYTEVGTTLTRNRNRSKFVKFIGNFLPVEKVGNMRFYDVRFAKPNESYFSAFICPYSHGNTHSVTLTDQGDFMFTANMDGCSFGVGIQVNGQVLVAHANEQAQPTNALNTTQQLVNLQNLSADNLTLVPGTYRTNQSQQATTVGIRKNNLWRFWYQQYEGYNDRHLIGVQEIS
jgi:hypothetical protein